jgi:hypothetical protein
LLNFPVLWRFDVFAALWLGLELVILLARNHLDVLRRFFVGIPLGFFTLGWILFISSAHSRLLTLHTVLRLSFSAISILGLRHFNLKVRVSSSIQSLTQSFSTLSLPHYRRFHPPPDG